MADFEPVRKFGAFELDQRSRALLKNGRKLRLQEQPYQVLTALINRAGEVVTREELRNRLWPANTFVDFDNGLSIAVGKLRQALNDDPGKPRYIETLPRVGYRFIAAVEVEEPPVAPPPETPTEPIAEPTPRYPNRWTWGLIATGAILALAVWIWFAEKPRATIASVTLRPSVAIMGFRNLAARSDHNWESTAFAEWLSTELEAGERVRTIPGESVARTKSDLSLPEVDSFSPETLSKIRKNTGADYIVTGSFFDTGTEPGSNVRLDLRMQDARVGQTVAAISQAGTTDDLPGLVKQAGLALRQKLGVGLAGQSDTGRRAAASAIAVARPYFEGLDKLRHFDAQGARDLLEQAVASDPNDAMAHQALSQAWTALGYAELAKREAQKAWELSAKLPRAEKLSIEAGYRAANVEWDPAIRIYKQLVDLFPDDADYGLRLARAQIAAGKAKDALATIERLRRIPSPALDDAAMKLVQSEVADNMGNFEQARTFAADAATAAQARGERILVAQARAQECLQLILLSRVDQAAEACESAKEIYAQAGDRAGMASSTAYLASTRFSRGDLAGARSLYTQALDTNRSLGNEGTALWEQGGLATVLLQEGDVAAARLQYEDALRISRLIASRHDEAVAEMNIAYTWMLEGNLHQAREMLEQTLPRFEAMSDKSGAGSLLNNLGQTLYLQGDLTAASNTLGKALAADRETGSKQETADVLARMGRVSLAQANWDAARRQFEESVKTAQQVGDSVFVAQCRTAMAGLSLATGHAAEAEKALRESIAVFERQNRQVQNLEARTLLAQALFDQGKTAEARQEVDRAAELAKSSQHLAARLALAIVAARVNGNARNLDSVIADAGKHGMLGYQLEARLAQAEIEWKQNKQAGARSVEKVRKDAQAHGFEAITRQAVK